MAIIDTPTEWQSKVLRYDESCNLAIFGGRGAGRTTCALFSAMRHCEAHGQGARVLFIRQTLRSLREVEDNLHLMLAAQYGDKLRVNRQDHIFIFPDGATIEFSPINDTEDMAKLQGRSFSLVIADEYGNFNPQQMRFVDQLRANLRAGSIPCRFILLANPGGRGHQQIKERFIDRMLPFRLGRMDDHLDWAWIPAKYTDNPHNPTNYSDSLFASAGSDKELFRAWAQGDWNIARGAYFADIIDEEVHRVKFDEVMRLIDPEHGGNRRGVFGFLAGDWGQSAPAVAFGVLKFLEPKGPFPRGSIVLLDEISSSHPDNRSQGLNWPIGMFAEAMEGVCDRSKNIIYKRGVIDDAKGLQPNDTLITSLRAAPYYFSFVRPMKNRRSGWAAMREMLANAKEKNGKAGQWVTERCEGWWDTVPLLPRNPASAEDVDTTSVDHWADANRYAVVHEIGEVRVLSAAQVTRQYPTAAGPTAPTLY